MKIIILAARISGNDGVSLEAVRWKEILEKMGHKITFVAGSLDQEGVVVPDLHFQSRRVVELHDRVVYGNEDYRKVEKEIFTIAGKIEGSLREIFNSGNKCNLLIVPNVFSLPMHFPLAVALARVVEDLSFQTIARHHDFWWERKRFLKSTMFPFFIKWFPPKLKTISHVVINSLSQKELKKRKGLKSEIIWDCFDFGSKKNLADAYSKSFRKDFGIEEDDIVFLQPTRLVERKRVELSVELVRKLNDPKIFFLVTGRDGDENGGYETKIRRLAREAGIRHAFIGKRINSHRKIIEGRRIYTLWDSFVNSDFVTYPTQIEGFGNQFVESVYFKKPIIVTPYEVYKKDIRPLDFETVEMPDKVDSNTLKKVRYLIDHKKEREKMTEKNFEIGKRFFSYDFISQKLEKVLKKLPNKL